MTIEIFEAKRSEIPSSLLRGMYNLRHKVFNKRLHWDVDDFGEMEIDQFDHQNPNYIIAHNYKKNIIGCWRLIPTTEKYMLEEVFSFLLGSYPLPKNKKIWELSRFAVEDKCIRGKKISEATLKMIKEIISFAQKNNISSYITVTSTGVERLMKNAGIPMQRVGAKNPVSIGKVNSVLCQIHINDNFINSVNNLSTNKLL